MDEELKARTMHLKVFIMWPMNEKGKLHKPSTDAMKLNKDIDACSSYSAFSNVCKSYDDCTFCCNR